MKRLIVLAIVACFFIGCGLYWSTDQKSETPQSNFTIIINQAPCPEGWEKARENGPNGIRRMGCYPIDFDYDEANERIIKHFIDKEDRGKCKG